MLTHKNIKLNDDDKLILITTKKKLFSRKTEEDAFYELCFCLCSPQTTFAKNDKLNKELRKRDFFNGFIAFPDLKLLTTEVRFYHRKASYLLEVKKAWRGEIWPGLNANNMTDYNKRSWLIEFVRGLGMKTASHFLRNALGCEYFAIIDTHVCKFLEINPPKSQAIYLAQEQRFVAIANNLGITPLELDVYIWSHYSGQPLEYVR
jgi:thermostable 8-oxoguanine DNA glycosylase